MEPQDGTKQGVEQTAGAAAAIAPERPDRRTRLGALIARHPVLTLLLLCVIQIVFWVGVPVLVNHSLPTDTLESFLWGREGIVMSYKHPQLPAWTLMTVHWLTGTYTLAGFLSSQIAVVLTFPLVYALGRELMGPRAAIAGVLLLPITGFYGWGTTQFNHDVAQLPFWAAISWLLWRAVAREGLVWWVLLGLVAGLGLYAKFTTGMIMGFGALWLFGSRTGRRSLSTGGPWVAMAIIFVAALPMVIDMVRMHFIQFTYAEVSNTWSIDNHGKLYYLGVQLVMFMFFPFALRSAGLIGRPGRVLPMAQSRLTEDGAARRYLFWMGLGPVILLIVASFFTGVGESWGKPMYSLVGLVTMAYLGGRLSDRGLGAIATWAAGVFLAVVAVYGISKPVKCYLQGHVNYTCLPAHRMAAGLQAAWHKEVGKPLSIVAGAEYTMMPTALYASDKPSMLTDFNHTYSPWVSDARIQREGMLIVWRGTGPAPKSMEPWVKGRTVQTQSFPWSSRWPPVVVSYVIVPPGAKDVPPLREHLNVHTM